ncbi:MAG: hypothetical protein ACI8YQ_002637 [Polaribacter sp.]|jgi:hypothetical protein
MPTYDINDPTDLDIMRARFDMVTHEEWEEYIAMAEAQKVGYKNVKILKTALRKTGIGKYLSPKVINWVLELTDRLDEEEFEDDDDDIEEEGQ